MENMNTLDYRESTSSVLWSCLAYAWNNRGQSWEALTWQWHYQVLLSFYSQMWLNKTYQVSCTAGVLVNHRNYIRETFHLMAQAHKHRGFSPWRMTLLLHNRNKRPLLPGPQQTDSTSFCTNNTKRKKELWEVLNLSPKECVCKLGMPKVISAICD